MASRFRYIDPEIVARSYRPKSGSMSPGLLRAREPYRVKNALTGLGLTAFIVGVWAYSMRAVRQDVFDDVDEEAKALQRSGVIASSSSAEEVPGRAKAVISPLRNDDDDEQKRRTLVDSGRDARLPRGLLVRALENRLPGILDPEHKTLVWGAPNVDNIGRIDDSR